MKTKLCLFLITISCCFLISCKKGDTGPAGTNGTNGTNGPAGPAGPTGPVGSANVIYSSWIDIQAEIIVKNASTPADETYFFGRQIIAVPALTEAIAGSGIVLLYFKNSEGTIFPVDREDTYAIQDKDANGIFDVYPAFTFKPGSIKFLTDAENTYLTRLNNSGAGFRYVIVPGGVSAARGINVRQLSYEEVAALYDIK